MSADLRAVILSEIDSFDDDMLVLIQAFILGLLSNK